MELKKWINKIKNKTKIIREIWKRTIEQLQLSEERNMEWKLSKMKKIKIEIRTGEIFNRQLDRLWGPDDAVVQHLRQSLKILQIAPLDRTDEPIGIL